jgi:uncharacterized repeat protein (TIGR01451 family)
MPTGEARRWGIGPRSMLLLLAAMMAWSVMADWSGASGASGRRELAPSIDFLGQQPPPLGYAAASGRRDRPHGQSGGWDLVFSEEFDGSILNTGRWHTCFWWASVTCSIESNNELQLYTSDGVQVQDGMLRLKAERRSMVGWNGHTYDYTSGMVMTGGRKDEKPPGFTFTYGYAEARIRVPRGKGLWSAFWLLPVNYESRPEIDIMEIIGDQTNVQNMNYHYLTSGGGRRDDGSEWDGPDFAGQWHTFAVDWRQDAIIWYVDGIERWRYADAATISSQPSYLLLNLAVGGEWPGPPNLLTPFPSTMDVDYVRVWKHGAVADTPRIPDLSATIRQQTADGADGPLAPGGNGRYAVTVTNAAEAGPTTGAITVRDRLPDGLRFIAGSGTGWSCGAIGQDVTCTNRGPLAPGETGALSLVVSVAQDAPPSLTNAIDVSTPDEVALQNNHVAVTSSVAVGCDSRPPMNVTTTRASGGRLQVTITSGTNEAVPTNALESFTLTETTNAQVDLVGGASGLTARSSVSLPPGAQRAQLVVRRVRSGPYIVRLTLRDGCGDWPTFVGEGS